MGTINTCYLDLDRVLVDFNTVAIKAMGLTREEWESKVPFGSYELYEGVMSVDEFWKCIEEYPDFWESLPKLPDADEILEVCESYFNCRVAFLTTPPKRNIQAYQGKARWVQKHYPRMVRKFFIGANKYLLAHSGAVLVDDSEKVCDEFKAAGGNVILVPDRGNRLYNMQKERVQLIKSVLGKMCSEQ